MEISNESLIEGYVGIEGWGLNFDGWGGFIEGWGGTVK